MTTWFVLPGFALAAFVGYQLGQWRPGSRRSIRGRLDWIAGLAEASWELENKQMSALDDINAKLDRINAATNNLAADVRGLKDQISAGMAPADVEAVQNRLESTAETLEALAAETPDAPATENPAPVEEPAPQEEPVQ